MNQIRIAGLDPALANYGIARALLTLRPMSLEIEDLILVRTENRKDKQVRKNSDNLRRGKELVAGLHEGVKGCTVAFAEVPSGTQSANASFALGIATGVLSSCPIPIIELQNFQVKMAAVGTKTASKEEMIEWAVEKYPNAPWPMHGKNVNKGKAEHLADAVATIHAGLQTDEFKQLLSMLLASQMPLAA